MFPGIELIGIDTYPQVLNGFYDYVLKNDVDFLLIDHELEKASAVNKCGKWGLSGPDSLERSNNKELKNSVPFLHLKCKNIENNHNEILSTNKTIRS